MNALSDIISVDPGRKTLAALHPEFNTAIWKAARIKYRKARRRETSLADCIFTSVSPGSNRYGIKAFVLRLLLAAVMIVSGSFILDGETMAPTSLLSPQLTGIIEVSIGGLLAIGFLTRLAMLVGITGFSYLAAMSALSGVFNMEALLGCVVCAVFLILGPGRFSCDFLIRKAICKVGGNKDK